VNSSKAIFVLLVIVYVVVRTINFPYHLNFSSEQAQFSLRALQIWENKELTLLGPPISFKTQGREIFQGSITYYLMIPFLLLGNLDPIVSSWLLVPFGAISLAALYYGTMLLLDKRRALVISFAYTLLPFFIDYTRFFWNPNFQLLLTPFLILLLGLYKNKNKPIYLFAVGILAGVLTMFHYQYVLIIVGILGYVIYKKANPYLYLLGALVGFAPMLIFEARNNFYNLTTILFYIQNHQGTTGFLPIHNFLSILLFMLILAVGIFKKINIKFIAAFFIVLIIISGVNYLPKPDNGFGMGKNWNYLYEKKVINIITTEKYDNYNIVNLGYDTKAWVQKYLHKINGDEFNFDDYETNEYLYVITPQKDYLNDPAYEISSFTPNELVKSWKINNDYVLILLKRRMSN